MGHMDHNASEIKKGTTGWINGHTLDQQLAEFYWLYVDGVLYG